MKKQCSKCLEWKELDEFYNDLRNKDKKQSKCKKCYCYYNNNRYKKDKNLFLSRNKKWRDNNSIHLNNYNLTHRKFFILWKSKIPNKIKPYEEIRQNEEFLEVRCTYCGKWYKPLYWEVQHRLQSINGTTGHTGENRLYCSPNCKKECPVFNQNKYPKGFKLSSSREVQPELRQLVLERDNYTCQKCNLTQDELKVGLHCHHKEGILWNPIESADMDMCITLCKNCHKEVHKIDGCKTSDMRCERDV